MTLTTYISASLFIFMSALVIKNKEAKEQSESLYNTKWTLKKIHTGAVPQDIKGDAFIIFHEEKKTAGGKGGCNSYGSTLSVSGNTVTLTNIFSTKMYCDGIQETEDAFLDRLAKTTRFDIKGKLLSLYMGKELLLELASE